MAHALVVPALLASLAAAQPPAHPGFGPPPSEPDLEIVERFDRDDDGRLDADERARARAWIAENRQPRRGPPGFRGPRGEDRAEPRVTRATFGPDDVPHYPDHAFYDPDVVRTVFIDFGTDDWFEELGAFYATDVDVPATVTIDGVVYRDVGVHVRGNTSYQMERGRKKPMHLDFNAVAKDQRVLGYRETTLVNNHGDRSQLREVLNAFVSRRHTAALRANLVRVVVDGEDLGVYTNLQHFDKDFLEETFGTREGTRFKVPQDFSGRGALADLGDDLDAYREAYDIKSKDDEDAWRRLRVLCGLLAQADDATLRRELPSFLDIDDALWFLAIDNALLDGDGYYARGSDYALYLDPDGRFHPLARDGNEVLGGGHERRRPRDDERPGHRRRRDGSPRSGMRRPQVDQAVLAMSDDDARPLVRRLLGIPEWRAQYVACVRELVTGTLAPQRLEPRIRGWGETIAGIADADVDSLLEAIDRRRAALLADPALRAE